MATEQSIRRPYYGSCHCGHTKYIAYLTLPPPIVSADAPADETTRIRKCNCTACHKTGFFQVRLPHAPSDFVLLSPTDPFDGGLADYQGLAKYAHWFFCQHCGVRCIIVGKRTEGREGERVEIDLEQWLGKESEGKKTKVWRCKSDGWDEKGFKTCLAINATTLDAGQEGLDLREWHKKGWIVYCDMLDRANEDRLGMPFNGGAY